MDPTLERIQVIGTSGTGKSELARRLSARLAIPHVELDDLNWLPGWRERPADEFRARLLEVVARQRWIIAGNYEHKAQEVIFPRATAIVWLDYRFAVTLWRTLRRSVRRIALREECCNGNRETIARALSRDSILLWVLHTHGPRRRATPERLARPENAHLRKLVFRTPRETAAWLRQL
jgi:adenylate kinase family enzyme